MQLFNHEEYASRVTSDCFAGYSPYVDGSRYVVLCSLDMIVYRSIELYDSLLISDEDDVIPMRLLADLGDCLQQ